MSAQCMDDVLKLCSFVKNDAYKLLVNIAWRALIPEEAGISRNEDGSFTVGHTILRDRQMWVKQSELAEALGTSQDRIRKLCKELEDEYHLPVRVLQTMPDGRRQGGVGNQTNIYYSPTREEILKAHSQWETENKERMAAKSAQSRANGRKAAERNKQRKRKAALAPSPTSNTGGGVPLHPSNSATSQDCENIDRGVPLHPSTGCARIPPIKKLVTNNNRGEVIPAEEREGNNLSCYIPVVMSSSESVGLVQCGPSWEGPTTGVMDSFSSSSIGLSGVSELPSTETVRQTYEDRCTSVTSDGVRIEYSTLDHKWRPEDFHERGEWVRRGERPLSPAPNADIIPPVPYF